MVMNPLVLSDPVIFFWNPPPYMQHSLHCLVVLPVNLTSTRIGCRFILPCLYLLYIDAIGPVGEAGE